MRTTTILLLMIIQNLLFIIINSDGAEYVGLELYPEHPGVFWQENGPSTQQFVAFGVLPDGKKENITTEVDWFTTAPEIVKINEVGLATALKPNGQVLVKACFPKPCKPLSTKVLVPVISWILLMERTQEEMWAFIYHLPKEYQELWFGKDSDQVVYKDWSEMRGLR